MVADLLHQLPLASAAIWIGVSPWPFLVKRRMSLPGLAFFLFAFLEGFWALVDWVFLNTRDPLLALRLSDIEAAAVTASPLFLLYFAKWTTKGRTRWDALYVGPVAAAIYLGVTVVNRGIIMEAWGPRLVRDPRFEALWGIQIAAYWGISARYLSKGAGALIEGDRFLGFRILGVVASTFLALLLGFWANVVADLGYFPGNPFASSLLWIPGALLMAFVAPLPWAQVRDAWRRMALGDHRKILAACLLEQNGSVLGVAAASGERLTYSRKLPEVLSIIDGFISTAFRSDLQTLATVAVGDITYMLSRGTRFILVLAVQGSFHDFFQGELQESLQTLEQKAETAKGGGEKPVTDVPGLGSFLHELVKPR